MSFGIKINALLTAMLLMGITFIFAMNAASAHTPNDTYWSNQWGPGNIYAPQAWDIQKGSTDVTIAILDTGVDYNHEDLAGRVIQGWNFVNNNSEVMDDYNGSHGTRVAGIAGAIMDNSKGITGIAQSKLLAVKTCNFMGICTWPSITDSIYYAADNGAKVISMSIKKDTNDSAAERAVNYAYNTKGALLVACAGEAYFGNGTEFIAYPGNFSNVIAVGATDSNDQRASFSNYGAKLELVAPGDNIYSTTRNNEYGYDSGCSMSVPHVSGVAALVWSKYPTLSNNEVRQILTNTADDLGSPGRDIYYGYGKVNAYSAVSYLPGWGHRKPKSITGTTAGAQANYQMKLTVYKGSGTDSPGVVYLGGNVRDDFGDLRFTKSDGVTLLDYWIESYTSGVSAVVWVEVDSIPASPNTADIYIYYSNPSATSASSGAATFAFFDDFNAGTSPDTNKWTVTNTGGTGSATVTNGYLDLYHAPGGNNERVNGKTNFSANVAFESRAKHVIWYWNWPLIVSTGYLQTNDYLSLGDISVYTYTKNGAKSGGTGTWNNDMTTTSGPSGTWIKYKIERLSNSAKYYKNDVLGSTLSSNIPSVSLPMGLIVDTGIPYNDPNGAEMYVDWVLVRKFVSPEPTWGS